MKGDYSQTILYNNLNPNYDINVITQTPCSIRFTSKRDNPQKHELKVNKINLKLTNVYDSELKTLSFFLIDFVNVFINTLQL